jgi:probable rRNA maturation factor
VTPHGAISFQFHLTPFRLRSRNGVRRWLQDCMNAEQQQIQEINFMFSTDAHVLSMNRQHLDHDYYTDILTFPSPSGLGISGDILISVDRVRQNANTLSVRPLDEMHRVMAHGLLHLIGQDDHTPDARTTMRSREDAWLQRRTFT